MPTLMLNDLVCFISRPSGVLGFPIIPSAVVMGCLFYKFRVVFVAIHLQLRISSPRRRRVLLSLLRPHVKFRVAVLQITRIFGRDFRNKASTTAVHAKPPGVLPLGTDHSFAPGSAVSENLHPTGSTFSARVHRL